MAATPSISIPLTLRLSKRTQDTLADRAAASGMDLAAYISALIEQTTRSPLSLEQISGPIYQKFLDSGTTDEELSEELEKGKHELRAERRARRAS